MKGRVLRRAGQQWLTREEVLSQDISRVSGEDVHLELLLPQQNSKSSTRNSGKYERQEKPNQIYERQESHLQLTSNIIMARTGALCV